MRKRVRIGISRLLVLTMLLGMLSTLTGCGVKISAISSASILEQITARVVTNMNMVKQLENAGLVTEKEYEAISVNAKSIIDSVSAIVSKYAADDTGVEAGGSADGELDTGDLSKIL